MPELPDLTVFAESLGKLVLNKEIAGVGYRRKPQQNPEPELLVSTLTGRRFTEVRRVGKELLFQLDNGERLLVHLMLNGGFSYLSGKERVPFTIMSVDFQDGTSLVLSDPKAWAKIAINPDLSGRAVDGLGVTPEFLRETFGKKPKTVLKTFLLDQQLIGGIGNAYADEILWEARISPKSVVGKLPEGAVEKLAAAIPAVLTRAVDYLRKHHSGMISGEIRDFLAVHNPKAKASPTGAPIIVEQVASKKTYYTEEQVLYR